MAHSKLRFTGDMIVYIHWEAFAPVSWKTGTLKGLIRRAFVICSTDESREKEISHLKRIFKELNGYPSQIIHDCIQEVQRKFERNHPVQDGSSTPGDAAGAVEEAARTPGAGVEVEVKPLISLPFKGKEGDKIIGQFRNALAKALPLGIKPCFAYKGKKIGSFFRVKDPVPIEHESDLIYAFRKEDELKYIGETKVRNGTRQHEHSRTDKKSAIFKYKAEKGLDVYPEDFEILEKGYPNTIKRKLAEALYIKELKPPLNEQVKSAKLCLFN